VKTCFTHQNTKSVTVQKNSKLERKLKRLAGFFDEDVMKILYENGKPPSTTAMELPVPNAIERQPSPLSKPDYEPDKLYNDPSISLVVNNDTLIPPILDRALVMVSRQFPITYLDRAMIIITVPQPTTDNTYHQNPFKVPMSKLKDILTVPANYEEAYFNKDTWCQQRWRAAIKLELNNMTDLKVWHPVQQSDVPCDRRLIKSKWVFDIKCTGIFQD
jgi:hypothetical protein